jgi:hypothetical protein
MASQEYLAASPPEPTGTRRPRRATLETTRLGRTTFMKAFSKSPTEPSAPYSRAVAMNLAR